MTTPALVIDLDPSNPPEIPDTLVQTPSVKGIGEVPNTQVLSWKKIVPYVKSHIIFRVHGVCEYHIYQQSGTQNPGQGME